MMSFGKRGFGMIAGAALIALAGTAVAMVQSPATPVSNSPGANSQVASIPGECLNMDLSPYSQPESLDIKGSKTPAHFDVEVASSDAQREQGLMCRANLKNDYGMLFEFDDSAERTFWMKDTISALDIIYIAPDGRIVSIQKNARVLDRTPLPSYGAASGVLEINAGLSDKLGLKAGDLVVHPFFHKP